MSDFSLSNEILESFAKLAEIHSARLRVSKTMLAGFIATRERDLRYMDQFMDPLYDFIEPGAETEDVMRQYIDYIRSFDAVEARKRTESLEDDLGYHVKTVFAAGLLAQKLHEGQKDKGGNDYFASHLLPVAMSGHNWKEKIAGFLHDAAEDTLYTVDEVISQLKTEEERVFGTPEEEWYEAWMDEIDNGCENQYRLSYEDENEIHDALTLLNHKKSEDRTEYIRKISQNSLALKVKLNDLDSNMDIKRISHPTEADFARMERYKAEREFLLRVLHKRAETEGLL